jgi:hypothetical protein
MSDAADRSATDPGVHPSRRELLRRAVGLAAVSPTLALLREPAVAHARVAPSIQGAGSLSAGTFPTVETRYGKVQGVKAGTVFQFKGVPYGAPTGGSNRFMPPRPPRAWTGVKECYAYGGVSPQMPPDPRGEYRLLAYDATKRATLIVDNETRVENDPNSEMRQLWEKVP